MKPLWENVNDVQGSSVQSTSLRRAEHSQTPISGMQFIAAKSIFRLSAQKT